MSDEEKLIFDIIKANTRMALSEFKVKSKLSNKKWGKSIKGLTKNNLVKVNNKDEGLFVEIV